MHVFDLGAAEVGRQPQPGRVPEGVADAERVVQDVLLRHDGDVLLERVEVGVQVLAVDQHAAAVGRRSAAEGRQQGRFARTGRPQQADELARADDQRDFVEQGQGLAGLAVGDHAADAARHQLDVVRAGARHQRRAVEQQGVGADVDLVAGPHDGRLADARAVDEGAVGAVEIDEDRPVVFQGDVGVHARDLRMRQGNLHLALVAADQHLARQRDGSQQLGGRRQGDRGGGAGHHRHQGGGRGGRGTGGRAGLRDRGGGEHGSLGLDGRRPGQEHESTLPRVETVLVRQRGAAADGLAVVIRRTVPRQRLDVVPALGADDAELLARAGDVEDRQVRRFAAADDERRGAEQGMQLLAGRVVQGGVGGLGHGRSPRRRRAATPLERAAAGFGLRRRDRL